MRLITERKPNYQKRPKEKTLPVWVNNSGVEDYVWSNQGVTYKEKYRYVKIRKGIKKINPEKRKEQRRFVSLAYQ